MRKELYKRNKKGDILTWRVYIQDECEEDREQYLIITKSGKYGGKETVSEDWVTVGKSNRNTYEQALLQANSKVNKKKDEGYKSLKDLKIYKSVSNYIHGKIKVDKSEGNLLNLLRLILPDNNTDASGNVKPMLAQPYKESKHSEYTGFYFFQPKLNGVRCLIIKDGDKWSAISRKGKNYNAVCEHIIRTLKVNPSVSINNNIIFDGELYIHEEALQSISGLCRKKDRVPEHDLIEYHIYDLAVEDLSFKERTEKLSSLFLGNENSIIKLVPTSYNRDIIKYHKLAVSKGYEGIMLRTETGEYEFGKRSHELIKYKKFLSEEFLILDIKLGKRGAQDMVFSCLTKDKKQFYVKPKGDTKLKERYVEEINNIVGKKLTTEFLEYTEDGIPSHAVGITIRDYE